MFARTTSQSVEGHPKMAAHVRAPAPRVAAGRRLLAPAALAACLAIGWPAAAARADVFGSGTNQFTMDFVTVGNPGNADDSGTTGLYSTAYGGVAYSYRIGTYEVSRQMITAANNLGALGITLQDMSLYGNAMDGSDPATGLNWREAARFVNWLNTSKGFTPAYNFTQQPGDFGYDARSNNIVLWQAGDAGYDADNPYRNANAGYFLPSEDEWYKAAFYSGSGSLYYDYPTGSDTTPTGVNSGTTANTAVFGRSTNTGPAAVTTAGGVSHYGTMGQGGNAAEWLESAADGTNNSATEDRTLRGGAWLNPESTLRSSYHLGQPITGETFIMGLRVVASVPEPSAGMLVLTAAVIPLVCLWRRST